MNRAFPRFGYKPATGDWNDSLVGQFLWSNANVSEAVPDVMTPSTWSLWWIFHYEVNPVQFPGAYPFCGNICGRPYFNLSLLVSAYRAIGRNARKELQSDFIGSAPADLDIPTVAFSKAAIYRTMLPGVLKAHIQASRDQKGVAEFVESMPRRCVTIRSAIANCRSTSELLALWLDEMRPIVFRSCQMLRSVTMTLGHQSARLHQELSAIMAQGDANTLFSNFTGTATELESLGPVIGLTRVKDGRMSRTEYLEQYGHRGPHEMELSTPGADDLGFTEEQWNALLDSAGDVEALLARQREVASATWQHFEGMFHSRAQKIRREMDRFGQAAKSRESVRSEVTRATRLLRSFLLRAGELTGLRDDIFFLSLDETVDLLAGRLPTTLGIPARRESYRKYASLPSYPAIIVGSFDPFRWFADPNRRSDLYDARQAATESASSTIRGFAGAAGCVEGLVRRIDCPEDGEQLRPGEILVSTTTNVGWAPLFPRLAAIVTDVGAPLSHAAIVAREMGIPAVVGCGNATMLLRTGDRVRVDGARGLVERLERVEASR